MADTEVTTRQLLDVIESSPYLQARLLRSYNAYSMGGDDRAAFRAAAHQFLGALYEEVRSRQVSV